MKKIVLIFLILFLFGCGNKLDVEKIMNDNEYVIIDVRTKEEYDTLHVKESVNIPYDEIENIDIDKNTVIFVYCKSGSRSKVAYDTLKKLGYVVYDLHGIDSVDLPKE